MGSSSEQSSGYDHSFKILLIGDSGVGKSSLLVSFISSPAEGLPPTIGADFKIKHITVGGKKLKLTFWDIGGQQRFGDLINSYYRNVQGIILVYDVTQRETFTNLSDVWTKQVERYCTNQDCVKIIVGNKVDKDSKRVVSTDEGIAVAKELKSLFIECSALAGVNVNKCFEELALKIMEVLEKKSILTPEPERQQHPPSGVDDGPKPETQNPLSGDVDNVPKPEAPPEGVKNEQKPKAPPAVPPYPPAVQAATVVPAPEVEVVAFVALAAVSAAVGAPAAAVALTVMAARAFGGWWGWW